MTARNLILALAAACLLSASGHVTAQAPPASTDAERLKAIEDKMDQILKLLEGRAPAPPTQDALDKQIKMLTQAKEQLLVKFEEAQREYQEFRLASPTLFGMGGSHQLVMQRIVKEEATAQDLRRRLAEVDARTALVKKVGDSVAENRGLIMLLQRRGVDVETLRKVAGGDSAGPLDMVRVYGDSLRLETDELQRLLETAQHRIDAEQKDGPRDEYLRSDGRTVANEQGAAPETARRSRFAVAAARSGARHIMRQPKP